MEKLDFIHSLNFKKPQILEFINIFYNSIIRLLFSQLMHLAHCQSAVYPVPVHKRYSRFAESLEDALQ